MRLRPLAGLAVGIAAESVGICGLVFNAWYDHRSASYEADSANPYFGYHTAAGFAFIIGGLLLLIGMVLGLATVARSSASRAVRAGGLFLAILAPIALFLRYRYRP